jgi:hypothetical protein
LLCGFIGSDEFGFIRGIFYCICEQCSEQVNFPYRVERSLPLKDPQGSVAL